MPPERTLWSAHQVVSTLVTFITASATPTAKSPSPTVASLRKTTCAPSLPFARAEKRLA